MESKNFIATTHEQIMELLADMQIEEVRENRTAHEVREAVSSVLDGFDGAFDAIMA